MHKTKKKSFNWYGMRQHFSIRKYHFGAASVLLGMSLALGAGAQVAQAEETVASSTASSASSEAVATETTVASTTETATSSSTETVASTTETAATTTDSLATTARTATISYIVQYVAEDGSVVKADVLSTTVNTTETTATTSVSVTAEAPTGYVLPTGQTAVVMQDVTENGVNIVTVKVVKKAEEKAATSATTTPASTATATAKPTEDAATTTATVAETVKTPATVEEAKVVLEQVTSEAEVLANESERLVAASDKENTALKAAATATKLTATEATAVLNDSTATLEAVNEQIDAVRTNVEALALELRKFLGTDLIQVALTTTTTVENGNGLTGTWVEDETVTNKEEASSAATVIPSSQEFPAGYVGDPSDKRTTFMIYSLSGLSDSGITPGTLDGSFNLRRGTDLYMVLSVNRSSDDGEFLYLNLYDKKTGQIALDDNGNKIQEELAVAVGQTKELTGLNAYAKQSNLTNKFKYTLSLTETEFKNAAGESSVLRNMQLKSGMGGKALNTLVYSNQTLSRGDYNDYSGTAPTYSPRQVTSYFVKATDLRDEEFLASYTQNGDLAGDRFTIAGESIFDNYELIESPTTTNGTLAADYVAGTALIRWYAGSLQSKVQYITKDDGSARYLQFLVNPDHPDFLETYAKYKTMSETNFQAEGETVFRLAERIAIVEKVEKDIAAVNADTTLSDEEKTAKIQTIRTEATAKINTADDKFFLTYSGENLDPLDYNDTADVVTGLDEWNYTSTKYKFSANNVTSATLSSKVGEYQGYPKAIWNNVNTGILTILDQDGKPVINPYTNTTMTFKAHQLSMFNSNGANFNNQRYYYAEKGGLKVYYVDTEGTVIKDENFVMPHENTDTSYDTATEEVKPKTITYKGEVYYYKEIDMISDNSLVPASQNTETEKRTIKKIDQETGVIEQDTLKELTYVYEKAGNVNINYVDTEGVPLSNKVIDVENGKPGSDYNTAQNKSEKPDTITTEDGTVYHLVPAGDYPVGNVSDNNNLTSVGNGTATGIDPVTGTVVAGETKEITYVYQKAGSVNINYVDTDGKVLQPKQADVTNGVPGSDYDTAQNKTEKPDTITTEDGTVYHLVPAGDYPVGNVSDTNNLTSVGNGRATGIDPVTGEVVAGETKEITYVYQKAGNVNVNYVDTKGNVIKDKVADEVNEPAGTDYDTVVDNKPEKITTEDGKVYYLAPAATYEVGTVSDDNNLTSVGNGTATGIDPITGEVEAGKTKEITYVYQEAGHVNVNYVDTDGNVIKLPVVDVKDGKPDSDYDTVVDNKPAEILYDGKLYKLVPAGTYKVGTVGESNNLTEVGNGEATGIDPVTGDVVAGETKEITYVYQLVTGNVVITYVDTEGNVLKSEVKDTTNEPVGESYSTKEDENEYPSTIEKDGETYYRVEEAGNHKVGETTEDGHLVSSDDPKGTVEEGTKTVTYVYEKAGNVNINYVDTEGNPLQAPVSDVKNGKAGTAYDTTESSTTKTEKPDTITTADGKVYKLVPAGDYPVGSVSDDNNLTSVGNGKATGIDPVTGKVVAGETKEITYVYKLVTGNVVITYVDTEGTPLKSEVKDTTDEEPGTPYNTKEGDNEYPSTIEKDGETYYRVEAGNHTVGNTTDDGHLVSSDDPKGTVEEGTKTVTYVYEKAGNVNVNYVDTDGKVLKGKVADVVNGKPGSDYDTVVDNKPATITTEDGKTYKLVPAGSYKVGVVGSNNNLTEVGNGEATGIDPVTGDVVAGETKEITYVYQLVTGSVVARYVIEGTETEIADDKSVKPKDTPVDEVYGDTPPTTITKDGKKYILVRTRENEGDAPKDGKVIEGEQTITYEYKEVKETPEVKSGNVNVNYVDTEGNVIKDKVADVVNEPAGTDYDTVVDNKPTTITKDGKTYKLVPSGSYNVGVVGSNNNLIEVGNGKAKGTDPVTGDVVADETKEITYVYQLVTGSVVARYVIEGTEDEIADDKSVKPKDTPVDEVYGDTPPTTITKDGKKYILVRTREKEGDAPKDGKVIEGEQTITYEYKEVKETPEVKSGNVVITYVDTEGNPLKSEVKDTTDGEVGSEYNTKENGDEYPETIVKDGVTYKRVKAGNHTVGETTEDGHLVRSDKPAGTVEEGTKTVTYVYEKVTGSVVARYVIEGTEDEIADDKSVKTKDTPVDEVYGDTPPTTITKDGKKYILVRTREKEGDAPKDGKVIEGEQTITYEYKEVKETPEVKSGNVVITYVDTEGNPLKSEVKDTTDGEVGSEYNTKENGDEYPETIVKDGVTYKRVKAGNHTVGETTEDGHLVSSDKPAGTVEEGTKTVTYVYEKVTGSVVARYVIEGTEDEIADDKSVKPKDTPVDEVYGDTPPTTITKDGKKYILVRTREKEGDAPKDGKVIEGEQTITYEYKEVKETPEVKSGNVVITYVDTKGNPLKSEVKDTTDGEVGSEYNTKENGDEYPETIVKDGVTYKRVKAGNHTVGETTEDGHLVSSDKPAGTVEEGTKTVTYVYEKVTGSVVARYVIEGTEDEIADDKSVKPKDTPVDEVYGDTPPTTITKDGKKYILVRTREKEGDAPKDGKVIEGEQTITYEYKEVKETPEVKSGNVNVNYVDTEGNVIKDKVADVVNEPAGTDYDTVVDNKPTTITKDGKTYKLVPSGSYKVGVVGSNNNLIEVGNGKAKGTDPVTGDVVADETKEITYVYQLVTGSVVARYVIEGTEDEIADDKSVKPKDTPVDEVYGDTPPTTITKDGKKYILVRTREKEGDAPKDGKVIEGEQTITYEYKEVKETPEVKSGNVVITYVDTKGNPLKSEVKDTTDGEVGSEYNTKENGDEYPETIVKDGVTYKRVKAGNHTVGETTEDGHLVSSDKPAGTVEEGTKTVTYVYEKVTGSVVARYVIEGTETEIADDKSVKPKETPVDEVYGDTPPLIIEKNGKKYILVRTRTNEGDAPKDGKVIEGEQVITYEYKELEENPTPVPPTPRPNPGRPGTPVTPEPGKPGTPVTPAPGKPATPAPAKPATPATPATPVSGKAQLPNTGEASSSATVLGAAMLVAALALVGKRRRNNED